MNFHERIHSQLQNFLNGAKDASTLNMALRLLSKWRSVLIQNTFIKHEGLSVLQGPLAGLKFTEQSAEGCHIPKLLGCYEQPLQPYIAQAIATDYKIVLNIGCAEGYYAVGMARKMPSTHFYAYDLDQRAQASCRDLAVKNDVTDRVSVSSLFSPEDFARFAYQQVLVLCDIEGAEVSLLNPEVAPSLRGMDIIVESHECMIPGITQKLIDRFSLTHSIKIVTDDGQRNLEDAPKWFLDLAHLDQLLAAWEWRSGPTPWLVMKSIASSVAK